VIRTDTMEELFDVAMLLANQPVPRGKRVAIITNAGGPGIMASDACESHGLEVVGLAEDTVAALRAFLPPEASTRNPVDMIASAAAESFEKSVRLVASDSSVDAVLAIYVPPIVTTPLEVAQAIVRGAAAAARDAAARHEAPKPVLSCFMGSHGVPEGLRSLHQAHIPSYAFPESAAIALARAVRYGRWLAEPEGTVRRFHDVDRPRAETAVTAALQRVTSDANAWLGVDEVRELLAAYRIATPTTIFASDAEAAVKAATRIGYPVAVKLVSNTILHKSDVGGVALDLRGPDDVREAFAAVERRLDSRGWRDRMAGVTVQPMVREGLETIVGVTHDPSFGPVLMFGMGGVHVELLRDVAFRIQPLTDRDARELVRSVRGFPLLEGYRGAASGDVQALEETLLRLSQLVGDFPEIAELDLNPLKVLAPGHGCVAVDARVAVR
jgi:acyl-CoA synthetase (NDP forming)